MRVWLSACLLALCAACAQAPAPQLAPEYRAEQQTLDRIARARSAVRWMAAVRVSLQALEGLEASLYAAGKVDPVTHARIDEWLDLVIEGGVAALTAIEVAGKQAAETGDMRLPAEAVQGLLSRLTSLGERIGQVTDADAFGRLAALLEAAVGPLRLILQILDPSGAVSLGHAAGRVASMAGQVVGAEAPGQEGLHPAIRPPHAIPPGVPTTTIPLRVYGPMAFGGVR